MSAKRINITIPESVLELVNDWAGKYHGGNVSSFLTHAAVYFGSKLETIQEPNGDSRIMEEISKLISGRIKEEEQNDVNENKL